METVDYHCRGNAVLSQATLPGVGDIWPDAASPGLQSVECCTVNTVVPS